MSYFFTLDGKQLFHPDPPERMPRPELLTLKQAMRMTKEEYEAYCADVDRYWRDEGL